MKVMKFGGSTIKTPQLVDRVAKIIHDDPAKKVVVISALHGQTNEIREYVSKIRTEKKEIDLFIENIRTRHNSLAKQAITHKEILNRIKSQMND